MSRKILYIGNDLASKTKYPTTMEILSSLLKSEKYLIYKSSDKNNIFYRLLDMIFTILKLRNRLDYILIDTYSTLSFYYAFIISQLARIFKIKYISILHGGNLPFRLDKSKKLSNLIFKNSYKNIAPSLYLKTEFEKRGFTVDFIPNVITIESYKFKQRNQIQPRLLFVRAFAGIYNPKMAIDVLKELQKTYKEAKLCMIGPDKDGTRKLVEARINELNLKESVEITGVLPKKEWHKKSEEFDVFINTTNIDNTPVSVIEAMALGIPVVSTNVGGLPYLIDNKVDGLLVNKNDTFAMVNKIEFLIENPLRAKNLVSSARKKVELFDWRVVKNQWKNILK